MFSKKLLSAAVDSGSRTAAVQSYFKFTRNSDSIED